MVREVVDDEDVADLAADLLPPLHPGERGEARADLIGAEPGRARRGVHAERVLDVVIAGHREEIVARTPARLAHEEPRALGAEPELFGHVVGVPLHGVRRHEGARRLLGDPHGVRIRGRDREEAVLGQRRGELLVRGLVVRHVAVDVGVIELDARENRRPGAVVQELGALVEVRGVVLVALDHDERAGAVAEVGVGVHRHAADEERRVGARRHEHVRHESGRRRLAVRADDHDAVLVREHERAERRREAHLRGAALAHGRRLGIHAPNDVPDDDEVGPRLVEVGRRIWCHDLHPPRREHVAHRGIDVLVAPGDLVAGGLEHAGEGAHPRSRHADEMDAADGAWCDLGEDVAVVVGHLVCERVRGRNDQLSRVPRGDASAPRPVAMLALGPAHR